MYEFFNKQFEPFGNDVGDPPHQEGVIKKLRVIHILESIGKFDSSDKPCSVFEVQSPTERFCHKNEEKGREGMALPQVSGILEEIPWSSID